MIAELSEGIPRNINNICFNALSLGCSLAQKTIDVEVLQQVAADFDLASLRSDPGLSAFERETSSLASAASEARSLLARSASTPLKIQSGEPLNPEDALAYMKEIIQRFKKDQDLAN
jgi:hypothetical protein